MLIGIVVALRWEAQCLQQVMQRPSRSVRWQLAGMGPAAAAAAAHSLIDQGARLLISYGCAAGLQTELPSGTALLPKKILTGNGNELICDSYWHQRFSSQLAKPCHAPLTEAVTVLASRSAKAALAAASGAAAADMESAMVMQVAAQHNIPALATRTVLDSAEQALPAGLVDCCDEYAQPKAGLLAGWLMRNPVRLQALYSLAKAQRQARQTLAAFAQIIENMK